MIYVYYIYIYYISYLFWGLASQHAGTQAHRHTAGIAGTGTPRPRNPIYQSTTTYLL
jgi:hypothetical protein